MQCVESAYALRGAVEWIIASLAEIPGNGALYSTLVPRFFQNDGTVEIIDLYIIGLYIKAYDVFVCGAMSAYVPQRNSRNEKLLSDFKTTEWYSAAGWEAAGW